MLLTTNKFHSNVFIFLFFSFFPSIGIRAEVKPLSSLPFLIFSEAV